MRNVARLTKIEKGLTPKQIVFAIIEESRGFPSVWEYALALAEGRAAKGPGLCDRIEAAMSKSIAGEKREAHVSRIREAQREGIFLATLAMECNCNIANLETEIRLRAALVASHLLLAVQADTRDSKWAERTRAASAIAEEQRWRVREIGRAHV